MENEKAKFLAYEEVRLGGLTNMFMINNVIALADEDLSREDIKYIMAHYSELTEKYL